MDEKELIEMVKNSLKAKKSKAEIFRGFQKRGYKLEYAEEIIKKAERPKKIIKIVILSLILLISVGIIYGLIFSKTTKAKISNPLSGFKITNTTQNTELKTTTYDDIKITPKFITYLLNEIGAWKLHKNPLTLKNPVINIKIGNKTFYSVITDKITTGKGLSNSADIEFIVNKKDIVDAIMSKNPEIIFKKSLTDGRSKINPIASKTVLFAKGYLDLYNSLKK